MSGVIAASLPPATHTSADPDRMSSTARAMACPLAAHAVVVQSLGPVNPNVRATCAAAMFGIITDTRRGLIRVGPFSASTDAWDSNAEIPPIPVPITTPTRSGGTRSGSSCASRTASCAAATANWAKRSMRRASGASM